MAIRTVAHSLVSKSFDEIMDWLCAGHTVHVVKDRQVQFCIVRPEAAEVATPASRTTTRTPKPKIEDAPPIDAPQYELAPPDPVPEGEVPFGYEWFCRIYRFDPADPETKVRFERWKNSTLPITKLTPTVKGVGTSDP